MSELLSAGGRWVAVAAFAASVALSGCAGGGSPPAATANAGAGPPTQPSSAECAAAARVLRPTAPPTLTPPTVGLYRYATSGLATASNGRSYRLPAELQMLVGRPQHSGYLTCLRVERRYGAKAAGTATVAIRGSQGFTLSADLYLLGQRATLKPNGPVPSGDMNSLASSGTFAGTFEGEGKAARFNGPAVGQWASQVIGQRTVRVGGRTLSTVGIEVRSSFRGATASGTDDAVAWVSLADRLPIVEQLTSVRTVGSLTGRLTYRARLKSTVPEPCCER